MSRSGSRIDVVIGLVFGEGHKAAEGDQPQGIEHAIALLLQQGWAKAHVETGDPDALANSGQEMACFVHHYQQRQD